MVVVKRSFVNWSCSSSNSSYVLTTEIINTRVKFFIESSLNIRQPENDSETKEQSNRIDKETDKSSLSFIIKCVV